MSWNDYVNAYLVNYVDQQHGKAYLNCCEQGGILSNTDGTMWAASTGFTLQKYPIEIEKEDGSGKEKIEVDEFKNLVNAFDNNGVSTAKGGIHINKEKYLIVSYNADKKIMYLKKAGGGGAVGKSGKAFSIATFSTSKKLTVKAGNNTTEQNQNPGICNTGVEKLQDFLLANNL
jgi:hypothetical protein